MSWSWVFQLGTLLLLLEVTVAQKRDCARPCIPIFDCPDLLKLIKTDVRVVQEATCAINGRIPTVCCPTTKEEIQSSSTTSRPREPNPLLPKNCGHFAQDNRVHGGNVTSLGNYPWMAALGYKNSFNNKIEFLCGGAVISERYILTAAHCLEKKLEVIRLAEWDLSTEIDCETTRTGLKFCAEEPAQDFKDEETILHPQFGKRGLVSDDIGLIRLASPISFNQWIQPVCLPERDTDVAATLGTRRVTVTGWGFTENNTASDLLLQVTLPQVDIAVCNQTYSGKLVGNQLCFGGIKGQDSCGGDSGGPAVMSQFNAPPYTQIGVVSFGPRSCGKKDVPGVYTDVASYRDWIDDNMRP